MNETTKAKFHPGQIVATPGALEALQNAGQSPMSSSSGICPATGATSTTKIAASMTLPSSIGSRILSAYTTRKGERLWVITEAADDHGRRASSCLLLPSEY